MTNRGRSQRVEDLLADAAALTDDEIDHLSYRIDDELVGSDPRPTLRALRELGRGHTGREPLPEDNL